MCFGTLDSLLFKVKNITNPAPRLLRTIFFYDMVRTDAIETLVEYTTQPCHLWPIELAFYWDDI
jgi:hypothetical protein